MPADWKEELVGEMDRQHITCRELSKELGVTRRYVCMILSGKRSPKGAEARFRAAIDKLIAQRNCATESVR